MAEPDGFPRYPERQNTVHGAVGPRPAYVFIAWLLVLVGAGTAGFIAAAATIPPSGNGDIFVSPLLLPAFCAATVLSGLAGWFVPAWGPYWGLVAAGPFLIGFWVQVGRHPAPPDDADFSPVGFLFMLVLAAVPWGISYAASLVRRN